ncbi:MAG: hypothetical protein COU42_02910 [Candidatus Nealsonbacteria bacterium CG10_big_fil_rev_8_21_14_0_10_36_24]|uniref:DUF5615 domain-containing protein n=2 Tax=Candidatus Nealsoniibacteriota TaxID=1817911 RepID=A0A2H0YN88_9BACT|nr:MAG: hypothetical protein COU42_02910 [Candidatus Nealsonbacteria bacterium CG10_big_fil_rev_8_21_14_0_10_36_24]PIS39975.1 MAG: hypothetical protein COT32_02250 [Candidatus Nealsonbacteria bacterium CG08_land_8_20_14_0_20_36_22]
MNLKRAPDEEIFNFTVEQKAILITRDLEFGNPHLYPPDSHHGLIIIRVPFYFTAEQINKTLKGFLSLIKIADLKGVITVVEPGKIRVRKVERERRGIGHFFLPILFMLK